MNGCKEWDCGHADFRPLVRLNQVISREFRYQIRKRRVCSHLRRRLLMRSGSVGITPTLFIEACRHMGLASRFVSGYLHAPATEAGNATTHAWVEIYLPGTGWKGFDPTSGEVTGNRHIAVAVARDSETVPPVSGSFIGHGAAMMRVNVQVTLLA